MRVGLCVAAALAAMTGCDGATGAEASTSASVSGAVDGIALDGTLGALARDDVDFPGLGPVTLISLGAFDSCVDLTDGARFELAVPTSRLATGTIPFSTNEAEIGVATIANAGCERARVTQDGAVELTLVSDARLEGTFDVTFSFIADGETGGSNGSCTTSRDCPANELCSEDVCVTATTTTLTGSFAADRVNSCTDLTSSCN